MAAGVAPANPRPLSSHRTWIGSHRRSCDGACSFYDVPDERRLGAGLEVMPRANDADLAHAAFAGEWNEAAAGDGRGGHGRDSRHAHAGGDHGEDGGELAALEGDAGVSS